MVTQSENSIMLSEEQLFTIFPYLQKEFETLSKKNFSGKNTSVHLLSAQYIRTINPEIPDPYVSMSIDRQVTHVSRTLIDIIDKNRNMHSLEPSYEWNFPCTYKESKGGISNGVLFPYYEKGDQAGDFLFRMRGDPLFVIVKNMNTNICYNDSQQKIDYRIQVYHIVTSAHKLIF